MNTCPKCQLELNKYPAGISKKTGKPFSARIQCSNSECDYIKWEDKPKKSQQTTNGQQIVAVEIIYELQAIREILQRIEDFLVEKNLQKRYRSQEPLKIVNEELQDISKRYKQQNTMDGEPSEVNIKDIPF